MTDQEIIVELQSGWWANIAGHAIVVSNPPAAKRMAELVRENAQLQQALVDAETSPYCEVCGSCGDADCGCTHKCKFAFEHPDVCSSIEAITLENQKLRSENARLRDVLERNIDDEPCWHDHHGYCQAHYLEYDCRVAAARAVLGETE